LDDAGLGDDDDDLLLFKDCLEVIKKGEVKPMRAKKRKAKPIGKSSSAKKKPTKRGTFKILNFEDDSDSEFDNESARKKPPRQSKRLSKVLNDEKENEDIMNEIDDEETPTKDSVKRSRESDDESQIEFQSSPLSVAKKMKA
jgi:hypothetical protein